MAHNFSTKYFMRRGGFIEHHNIQTHLVFILFQIELLVEYILLFIIFLQYYSIIFCAPDWTQIKLSINSMFFL